MACRDLLTGVSVRDVMRPCPVFVNSQDLVTRARAVMRSSGLRALLVVDDGKLSGTLTEREIIKVTSTRSNIKISGLMLPPRLVATPSMGLTELAMQMVDIEIYNVPVVQSRSDNTVVGLVNLDDILRKIGSKMPRDKSVGSVMVKNVVTCEVDDEITKIWNIMKETNYSGLPVVRYDRRRRVNEVIGIVSRMDIIRSGATRLSEESDKGRFRVPPKVGAIMRTPAIVVSPQSSLVEAIELMVGRDIGRLPVVEGGSLVGIISRSDIIEFACG